jgi:hypothetical protein
MTTMKRNLHVSARGRSIVISIFMSRIDLRHCTRAMVLLVLLLGSSGCGSSNQDVTVTTLHKNEPEYRIEGTGKNQRKVRVNWRDAKHEEFIEASKKQQ